MEIFKCQYCGTPYLIERSDGGIRITRLEERVSKVEDEQAQMRAGLVEAKILQVRRSIDQIFNELNRIADGKKRAAYFQASNIEDLYEEEWELRKEYIAKGGEKADIVGFINPVGVIPMLRELLPRAKNLRVGFGSKITWRPFEVYYYPTVENYWLMQTSTLVEFKRDEVKVKLRGSFKEQLASKLEQLYPGMQIR